MEILNKTKKLCVSCMEEHDVQLVKIRENNIFKNEPVEYEAVYEYCDNTDEYFSTGEYISKNDISMKDAYRKLKGLLTSNEIIAIRKKYKLSQKDFARILNWGEATITRYENHQVQDAAHDEIMRKVDSDPQWFIQLIKDAAENITRKAAEKYNKEALSQYAKNSQTYLMIYIDSLYAGIEKDSIYTGFNELNIVKIKDMINVFASLVKACYKVKLMKLLWYADSLNFKKYGKSISGLAYSAKPMGALPIGHNQIININGVSYEEVFFECDEGIGYKFAADIKIEETHLNNDEKATVMQVIKSIGTKSTKEIVDYMHEEEAFKNTKPNELISFAYAKNLRLE